MFNAQNTRFVIKTLNLHTTTRCTLKCRHCAGYYPYFSDVNQSEVSVIKTSLNRVFQVADYIDDLRLGGAEAFLHPDFPAIVNEISQYKSKFKSLLIITNGTYVPTERAVSALKHTQCPYLVRVDDYGHLSKSIKKLQEHFEAEKINFEIRKYNEEEQAFGGWIDLGNYSHKGYSVAEFERVYSNCFQGKGQYLQLWDGILYICCWAGSGHNLHKLQSSDDHIDILKESSVNAIRDRIRKWATKPVDACNFCNGYDPENSPRITAAQQLDGR